MSKIDIVEVESSSQLDKFITYPSELYEGDPCYVAPLRSERREFFDKKKNPFYHSAKTKLFLAVSGRRICGRIGLCINYTHNEYHNEQTGFFGFFDCDDDFEVASKLLKVAMIELKREGMEKMRGPASFSTNHECGFLIEGFDSPPMVMMTYNRPYLPRLAERFGLKKAMDLVAYKLTEDDPIPERSRRIVSRLQQRSEISMRPIDMSNFEAEVRQINELYNQAWEHNWGFVPMSPEEFSHLGKQLRQIVDPDLILIAEHEGTPIAFLMALPDINQALIHLKGRLFPLGIFKLLWHTKIRDKIDRTRIVTMGVIPQYQKRGVDSMLYVACHTKCLERGYRWAELSWVLETNQLMRKAAEQMGAKIYKRYRIVEMPI